MSQPPRLTVGDAKRLLARVSPRLSALPGVRSVGFGLRGGVPSIILTVATANEQRSLKSSLGGMLEGVPIVIEVSSVSIPSMAFGM